MRDRPTRWIWLLIAAGSAFAGFAQLALLRIPAPPHHFPVLALVGLFGAAEVMVVHVETRSQTHTFSLVELPLVIGLLADPPWALLAAHVIGAAVVLSVIRRQAVIKLAYNLTAFAVEAVAAQLIFHAVSDGRDLLAGRTMAGVFAATLTASLIGIAAVFVVVNFTEGRQPLTDQSLQLMFGAAATGVSTSTMLIGAVLYVTDTAAMWLLLLPIFGVYLAEKAYTTQIREQRRLRLLRNSTALVSGLGSDESIESLLQQVRQTFHSGVAALIYLPGGLPDSLALTVIGPEDSGPRTTVVDREEHWDEWASVAPGRVARLITSPRESRHLGELIGHPNLRQGMVVALCGDLNVIGYLVVGERLNEMTPFSDEDLDVLDTLERFVSMGLANGHLEQSLEEARMLERQLVHRATHDGLTGLANRTLLADYLSQALTDTRDTALACFFIDLDDFKSINDRFGHQSGDQLLVITAQRLVNCLRDGDLAARLGGDEMAVVARVAHGSEGEALTLGRRIVEQLSRPASVRGESVITSASVGIVLCQPGDSAEEVLAAADSAMYAAKSGGKCRAEIVVRGHEADPIRTL